MADSPITVTALSVTPGFRLNVVRWSASIGSCLPYLTLDKFEVYSATVNNINSALKVGESADVSFTHPGLIIGAARYYWVRARDVSGNLGDFYPPSATGGIVGVPTSIGPGVVGHDELQDDAVDFNNIRVGSVRAQHIDAGAVKADKINVIALSAISSVLGDVQVNGALVLAGTIDTTQLKDKSVNKVTVQPITVTTVTVNGAIVVLASLPVTIADHPVTVSAYIPSWTWPSAGTQLYTLGLRVGSPFVSTLRDKIEVSSNNTGGTHSTPDIMAFDLDGPNGDYVVQLIGTNSGGHPSSNMSINPASFIKVHRPVV